MKVADEGVFFSFSLCHPLSSCHVRDVERAPLFLSSSVPSLSCVVAATRNIVATVNLDCRLDLKTIALHARNAEYNPKVCNVVSFDRR